MNFKHYVADIMDLNTCLKEHGFVEFEGNSNEVPDQQKEIVKLTADKTHIMEIGFNAGHSADLILKNNPNARVTSFDIGSHPYILTAKEYIDKTYPGRHRLVLGDSRSAVLNFLRENPATVFEVIIIDGGHEYSTAQTDFFNCRRLSSKNTLVILDDVIYNADWHHGHTRGPSQVWQEALQNNSIEEFGHQDYQPGRGMAWGRYIL